MLPNSTQGPDPLEVIRRRYVIQQSQNLLLMWVVVAFTFGVGGAIVGLVFRGITFVFTSALLLVSIPEVGSTKTRLSFKSLMNVEKDRMSLGRTAAGTYGLMRKRQKTLSLSVSIVRLILAMGFGTMAVFRIVTPIEVEFKSRLDGDVALLSLSSFLAIFGVIIITFALRYSHILRSGSLRLLSFFLMSALFAFLVSIIVYALEYSELNSLVLSGKIGYDQMRIHVVNDLLHDPVGALILTGLSAVLGALGIIRHLCPESVDSEVPDEKVSPSTSFAPVPVTPDNQSAQGFDDSMYGTSVIVSSESSSPNPLRAKSGFVRKAVPSKPKSKKRAQKEEVSVWQKA